LSSPEIEIGELELFELLGGCELLCCELLGGSELDE
jgi:hypothetical protein